MLNIDNLRIRRIESNDASFLTDLRSDFDVNSMLGHFIFPTEESQAEWIKLISKNTECMYFILEKNEKDSSISIGIIRVNHIDYINRSCSVGGDIAADFRGKGYGKTMFKIIFELCFNYLNMHRLWLHVLENNTKAIKLYKKVGFTEEGLQRQAVFRKGKYLDYIMMSILRNEAKKI